MGIFRKNKEAMVMGDPIPLYHEGRFHIFYLTSPVGTTVWPDRIRTTWQHAVTDDLIHWEELPPALEPGVGCKIDKDGCWTGSAIVANGKFHIFYTAADLDCENQQKICHACSEDGITFVKDGDEPVIVPDGEIYELVDWRDPYVFYNEEDACYWILIAGRKNNGPDTRRGVVALYKSEDLQRWKHWGILCDPGYTNVMECPEMYYFAGKWYLSHSRFSESAQTIYRVSDTPYGPWRYPQHNGIGGRRFYAAKSVANDEGRRFYFGWVHDREENKDEKNWLWGGDFCIPRELEALPDGELKFKMPKEIYQLFQDTQPLRFVEKYGNITKENDCIKVDSLEKLAYGFFDVDSREFLFECDVHMTDVADRAGFLIKASDDIAKGYLLSLDRGNQRISLTKYPVPMDPYWADASVAVKDFSNVEPDGPCVAEKAYTLDNGQIVNVKIVIDGSIMEIFVDNSVTFSFRCCEKPEHEIGLLAQDAIVTFENIQIKVEDKMA